MTLLKKSPVKLSETPTDKNDLKLKNIIKESTLKQVSNFDIALIGVPFDLGVKYNGGRIGCAKGPDSVRTALKKYGSTFNLEQKTDLSKLRIANLGNIVVKKNDVIKTHKRVTSVVEKVLEKNVLPIVIGGGHDITFANVRGLVNSTKGNIGGINVDAHFDVRTYIGKKINSGTSFRRILEELNSAVLGKNFLEFGAQNNNNSLYYYNYLKKKKVRIISLQELRNKGVEKEFKRALKIVGNATKANFFSFDIDSVSQTFAPGCSAPAISGLTSEEALKIAFLAGKDKKVKLMDLMEINPLYDVDERTARLGAGIIVSFLNGFIMR